MMAHTHAAFAFLIGVVLLRFVEIGNPILFLGVIMFASLLPDVDHLGSTLGKRVWPLSLFASLVFGHRGFLHSVWPALTLFGFFAAVGQFYIGLAAFLGYVSHIIADMMTVGGVMPFHPFKKKFSGFIRTNSLLEYVLFAVIVFAGAIQFVFLELF